MLMGMVRVQTTLARSALGITSLAVLFAVVGLRIDPQRIGYMVTAVFVAIVCGACGALVASPFDRVKIGAVLGSFLGLATWIAAKVFLGFGSIPGLP
jgi:hypothetical protein